MHKSKYYLIFQTILTFPIVLFLFLYNRDNSLIYNVTAIFLILVLVYNYINTQKNKPIIKIPILLFMIIPFFFYAFQHLGSKHTPQTYQTYNYTKMETLFTFNSATNIDEVCYYFFIDKNVEFKIENKNKDRWENIYQYKNRYPSSFKWNCYPIKEKSVKELKMTTLKSQMMLAEIRFRSKGKDINFTSSYPKLNDEPNIKVSKSYYDGTIYDEIYHPRTAYEIMKGVYPVYENTHPYLGKLLIIPGIKLFGMTPFGWRFTNVLFGAIFIFVAYFFALKLFRDKLYAFVASFLMMYSFMHLTQSRLGLIDTFGVLFVFISYYFFYDFIKKQKLSLLFLSGLFFGLASAVKWSAVFASLGFVLIAIYLLATHYPLDKRFKGYRLILYGLLTHGLFALFIYTLTFYDIYFHTGSFQSIIDYQVNMYAYHSHLIDTHPYSSPWWSWPIDMKPMCATRNIVNGTFSSVTMFGNPAIFWTGIVAIAYLIYIFFKRRTLEGTVILFAFMALYLPYAFITRLMFMYHYYYAIPFLILAVVYGIKDFLNYYPKYSILLWIYLVVVAGLFLLFYPVLSGYEVPKSYVDNYLIWFPTWWL